MSSGFASTPQPPYWMVAFTSRRSAIDDEAYAAAADRMLALATTQPGFLGAESVRGTDGLSITLSHGRDEAAIEGWRTHAEHTAVREKARVRWYDHFEVRIAKVERAYSRRADR